MRRNILTGPVMAMVAALAMPKPSNDFGIEMFDDLKEWYKPSNMRHHNNKGKYRKAFTSPRKPKLAKLWRERKGFHAYG